MNDLLQNVRYGLRQLRRNPGFTAVALLTLTLCIGANTAIFTVVNAVLLRDLPFPEPDRLVRIWELKRKEGRRANVAPQTFLEWRERQKSFESIAAYQFGNFVLSGPGEPERTLGLQVSAEFFQVLGIPPERGRSFFSGEDIEGQNRVAILSHGFWQRRFAGDPQIVGRSISVNGAATTVVGVMPGRFQFANPGVDLWVPLVMDRAGATGRLRYLNVVGRMRSDVTLEQAQAETDAVTRAMEQQLLSPGPRQALPPDSFHDTGASVVPLKEQVVGELRPAILALFGAVVLVLLIGCSNVASLLFARATARRREFAVRMALGAHRIHVVRQLVIESLLLATIAGGAALVVSLWTVDALVVLNPALLRIRQIAPDGWVLAFTAGISFLSAIAFGCAPAIRSSKLDLHVALKETGSPATPRRRAPRALLMACQVALALMLLINAGLLIRSYLHLRAVDTGFNAEGVLVFHASLPMQRPEALRQTMPPAGDPAAPPAAFRDLLRRIESLPGVIAAGATDELPFGFTRTTRSFEIQGRPSTPDRPLIADVCSASPGYFRAMGIPLLMGRGFTDQDSPGSPRVAIINPRLADRFWPGESPLGKRVILDAPPEAYEIVGVAGNVRHGSLREEFGPEIYVSWQQNRLVATAALLSPNREMGFAVRSALEPATLIPAIRAAARETSGNLPLFAIRPLDQAVGETISAQRSNSFLLGTFAAMAVVLATLGIYGVIAYGVEQRRREIGIRMSLGARPADIFALVMKEGGLALLVGLIAGTLGALAVTRVVSRLLYGVAATDPMSYLTAAGLLGFSALLACYFPARQAARLDPMVTLRDE